MSNGNNNASNTINIKNNDMISSVGGTGGNRELNFGQLMDLCLEKTFQVVAVIMAMLVTTTVSYFAGPMPVICYMVMLIIPMTLLVSVFPEAMCIRIKGINLTSKSSDISWMLIFWGYWTSMNYIHMLCKMSWPFGLWWILPMNICLFLLALISRLSEYIGLGIMVNMFAVVLFPIESVGIFREEWIVTIVRVALYFLSFYIVEFATKTSGRALLSYTCWILTVWKWILPFLVVQYAYVFITDYFKNEDGIFSSLRKNNNKTTTTTTTTTTTSLPISGKITPRSPPTRNNDVSTTTTGKGSQRGLVAATTNSSPDPSNSSSPKKHGKSHSNGGHKKDKSSNSKNKSKSKRSKRDESNDDDEDSNEEEETNVEASVRSPNQYPFAWQDDQHPLYQDDEVYDNY